LYLSFMHVILASKKIQCLTFLNLLTTFYQFNRFLLQTIPLFKFLFTYNFLLQIRWFMDEKTILIWNFY
jgi:hypothetical protein